MGKLIPILAILIGLGGGVGAGLTLRPDPTKCAEDDAACKEEQAEAKAAEEEKKDKAKEGKPTEFSELNRQFVISLLKDERVSALVVASLVVEMLEGQGTEVFTHEPKLRDAFLQVMFVHAQSGGFDGAFTSGPAMLDLKMRLKEVAKPILGDGLVDVLITEIVRQDL